MSINAINRTYTMSDGEGNTTLTNNTLIKLYYDYWLPDPNSTNPNGLAELKFIDLSQTGLVDASFDFLDLLPVVNLSDSTNNIILDVNSNPINFDVISIKLQNMKGITTANLINLNKLQIINDDCFLDCTLLSTLMFPTTLNQISDHALKNCSSLTTINLPNSIDYLGNGVFQNCLNLSDVTINGNVTILYDDVFNNCPNLSNVNIPNSITEFRDSCFKDSGISVTELKINYSNGKSYLPTSLINLGNDCFNGSNIKQIILPNTVTGLGAYCFANITNLSIGTTINKIILPTGVINIGDFCFQNLSNITFVSINYNPNLTIGLNIFANFNTNNYANIIIPCDASNTNIPSKILDYGIVSNYITLKIIQISPGSPSIPDEFFLDNLIIETINIPTSVTYIGQRAFTGCSKLKNDHNNFMISNDILEIPNTVKYIGVECFKSCSSLKNVIVNLYTEYNPNTSAFDKKNPLPDTASSNVFLFCNNLIAATLPLEPNNRTLGNLGIRSIQFTTLTVSDGVKNIVANACQYYRLITVNFPASLETIGNEAFKGCSLLNVSNLSNTVTIGTNAFQGVASLTTITSNGYIETLSDSAFANCTNLTTVDLPLSIKNIGNNCFSGCTKLNTVKINNYYDLTGTPIIIGTNIFNGCSDLSSVILPLGGNYTLSNPFGITDVNFNKLKEISISSDVANISDIAMYNFNTVETVKLLNSSLNSVGDRSFRNCKGLKEITISKDLGNNNLIDNHAFENCASLQTINMPNSIITVDASINYIITQMDAIYNTNLAGTYQFSTNKYTYIINKFYDATDISTNLISTAVTTCDNLYFPPVGATPGSFSSNGVCISQNNSLSSATGLSNVQNWIFNNNPTANLYSVSNGSRNIVTPYNQNFTSIANFVQIGTPIAIICFPFNTPIKTDQGIVKIGEIIPNVHTIRNKKINLITKTVTLDKYLVCFEKDSLGKNIPSEKTIMTKNHKVMHNGVMVMAKELLNKYDGIYKIKYDGEILYNILLDNKHDKLMVNNLICETLDPENFITKMYKKISNLNLDEKNKIIDSYNDFVKTTLKKDPSKYKKYFK